MGEVSDPWKDESLVALPAELLQAGLPDIVSALKDLNDSGHRLSVEQADVIYRRFVAERSEPFNPVELNKVLFALALARHPKAPAFVEYVFGIEDSDFIEVACRALLAWHGLPDLFLIWVDKLYAKDFEQLPVTAQDYIRGVNMTQTQQGCGTEYYFEAAAPERLRAMSEALVRMGMPESATALDEAGEWWKKMENLYDLDLPEAEFHTERERLHAKWEAAVGRMYSKVDVLEGISRFAVKHSAEFRSLLDWMAPPPAP